MSSKKKTVSVMPKSLRNIDLKTMAEESDPAPVIQKDVKTVSNNTQRVDETISENAGWNQIFNTAFEYKKHPPRDKAILYVSEEVKIAIDQLCAMYGKDVNKLGLITSILEWWLSENKGNIKTVLGDKGTKFFE